MKCKKSFFAGLLTVIVLAALGYVVYRYRTLIAARLDMLFDRVHRFCPRQRDEYDDFADV